MVPTEHQLLIFWLQVFMLVAVARALGGLMRRIGQPAVIGELAAGLLLGPSVFGVLMPDAQEWLFPTDPLQRSLLAGPAWIGVFLLLVLTGLETDLALVRRLGRGVAFVAIGSLLIPVLAGINLGLSLPESFVGEGAPRPVFALFMGTALGISALPVIAKILSDLGLMRRNLAQVLLAAAMLDDFAGWILLGTVAGLARSGSLETDRLVLAVGGLVFFLVGAFTLGRRGVDALLRLVRVRGGGVAGGLTAVVLVALASGVLTHALGLEAVLGAFIAGIVLGNSRFHDPEVFPHLEGITRSFFAPLFFATAGLRVDLSLLAEPEVLRWGILVVVIATLSKSGGSYLGARIAGLPQREGLGLAAGLNARGAVEIVVATVGLSLGVLNSASYAVVVLLAMVTSMMAPPLLRAVMGGWAGSEEERERLARERLLGGNVLVRPSRILLPSHGGPNSVLAAQIVDLAWPEGIEVTVLAAGGDVPAEDVARVRAAFSGRPLVYEHAPGKEPIAAILEHAGLGYGAIAVGATDTRIAGTLVSPMVDELLAVSPLPVIMVRRGAGVDPTAPLAFRRILVPAIGTQPGRAAQEMAYSFARRLDVPVFVAHVVTLPSLEQELSYAHPAQAMEPERVEQAEVAERVVEEARELAREMGVRAVPVIRTAVSAPEAILALARERQVDLLVLAANLRQLSGRPFLGHGVEYLLQESESTVVVVTAPPGWGGPSRGVRGAA
jgi:Kef-type K+ transport system membrane component KefB/nucleotide-binding universal stress UspA family protein